MHYIFFSNFFFFFFWIKYESFFILLHKIINNITSVSLYLLNYYLLLTYPVLLNIQYQYYFNILIFYLIWHLRDYHFILINLSIGVVDEHFKTKLNKIFKLSNYWFRFWFLYTIFIKNMIFWLNIHFYRNILLYIYF